MNHKRIRKNLRIIRKIFNLSFSYLEEETGICRFYLQRVEYGDEKLKRKEIEKLCDYLMISKRWMNCYNTLSSARKNLKNHPLYYVDYEIIYVKKRKCLSCEEKFLSKGKSNRLCKYCLKYFKEQKSMISAEHYKNKYKMIFDEFK